MRAIAIIDRQPADQSMAVWLTSREGLSAHHTNAVVIDASDPDAMLKVRSLTRCCLVLSTEGSELDGLPIDGEALRAGDIALLADATRERQQSIRDAITGFKRRGGSKAHKEPSFTYAPEVADFTPPEDTAAQRALATANYLAKAWSAWLTTDEERRRVRLNPARA